MLELEEFPKVTAGIQTMSCECGWSMSFVVPEELMYLTAFVMAHLIEHHEIKLPIFTVEAH